MLDFISFRSCSCVSDLNALQELDPICLEVAHFVRDAIECSLCLHRAHEDQDHVEGPEEPTS
jgi:hypothetical protein